MFASYGTLNGNTTLVSVLFQIEVKEGTQSFFADISKFSSMANEEEVLFDLNAVFMIQNIHYSDLDECWIINLVADEETYVKHEHLYKELCEIYHFNSLPFLTIGISLLMIGHTREAYRYACLLISSYGWISGLDMFFILTCISECDYSGALRFSKQIYENV
jgi:hypothetical protein